MLGEYEDGYMPLPKSLRRPHGTRIASESGIRLMTPDEQVYWECLYQTVVDCYKIATGRAEHFFCMRWHDNKETERILTTARTWTEGWIDSESFADHAQMFGWNPDKARAGLREILDGEHLEEAEALIKQINKERDARRNREENFNE